MVSVMGEGMSAGGLLTAVGTVAVIGVGSAFGYVAWQMRRRPPQIVPARPARPLPPAPPPANDTRDTLRGVHVTPVTVPRIPVDRLPPLDVPAEAAIDVAAPTVPLRPDRTARVADLRTAFPGYLPMPAPTRPAVPDAARAVRPEPAPTRATLPPGMAALAKAFHLEGRSTGLTSEFNTSDALAAAGIDPDGPMPWDEIPA